MSCSVSKDPTFYALEPVRGVALPSRARIIELRRPSVAGYLDRSDIVRRVTGYRLDISTEDSWAEPLGDMIARVMAQDLEERLPGATFLTETAEISAPTDAVVSIDVQRFESDASGDVVLDAEVVVASGKPEKNVVAKRVAIRERRRGNDTASLVAAMSRALGRLSDEVSVVLRAV